MLIEHEHRRMGHAVDLLVPVRLVAKAEAIDHRRARIRKQGEAELSAAVFGHLAIEDATDLRAVWTDRIEADVGEGAGEITESDQLPDAVRSPVAAIEHEHDLVPSLSGEMHGLAILIGESEVGRNLPDGERAEQQRNEK